MNDPASRIAQQTIPSQDVSALQGPELVFALAGAVGTNQREVYKNLEKALKDVQYSCEYISVIDLLDELSDRFKWLGVVPKKPEHKRLHALMDRGNQCREKLGHDALALLAVGAIRNKRQGKTGEANKPSPRQAYVLRSLKHKAEVDTLRDIMDLRLFLYQLIRPDGSGSTGLAKK